MKYLCIGLIGFLLVSSTVTKNSYDETVDELVRCIRRKKKFPEHFFQTQEDAIINAKKEGFYKNDTQIKELVERRHLQQTDQYKRILKTAHDNGRMQFKFLQSDSIGGVVKGVHFIDIGLIYKNRHPVGPGDEKQVVVFEMIEMDGRYIMCDDIYDCSAGMWENHVTAKKKYLSETTR